MALADPQSITVDGAAKSLARSGLSLEGGRFRDATGVYTMDIQHTRTKQRVRHLVKVSVQDIVSNPLVPTQNVPVGYSAHIVFDAPVQGVTNDQLQKLGSALVAWATAANIGKVVGGES